jgi:hypothetical protein
MFDRLINKSHIIGWLRSNNGHSRPCYLTGDTTFSSPVTDMAQGNANPRLAKHASPRQVAGGALDQSILKCQLKHEAVSPLTAAGPGGQPLPPTPVSNGA